MSDRGLFVVIEGGDRVGKSTQVRALAAALELSGVDHVITHEPGGTPVGNTLRDLLLDPESDLDDRCEALLAVGRVADAALELERLTKEEPTRERRWGLLMAALHRLDRQADALRAYHPVRDDLLRRAGAAPGPFPPIVEGAGARRPEPAAS